MTRLEQLEFWLIYQSEVCPVINYKIFTKDNVKYIKITSIMHDGKAAPISFTMELKFVNKPFIFTSINDANLAANNEGKLSCRNGTCKAKIRWLSDKTHRETRRLSRREREEHYKDRLKKKAKRYQGAMMSDDNTRAIRKYWHKGRYRMFIKGATKKVRHYDEIIANGGAYKKIQDPYNYD